MKRDKINNDPRVQDYSTNCILDITVYMIKVSGYGTKENKRLTYVDENFVPCLTTFSTASKKSRSVATFRRARIANIPAFEII